MKRIRFRRKVEQQLNIRNIYPINQEIGRFTQQVSLINEIGEPLGTKSLSEALNLANEAGLDLVCVAPKAVPPVAKIMDFGSFKYKKEKELKKQKSSGKQTDIKTIRLSLRIGKHDLDFRIDQAQGFIEREDKVRIEMMLKGREMQYANKAFEIINGFITELGQKIPVKVESPTKRMGGRFEAVVMPA